MIKEVCKKLDKWIEGENSDRKLAGASTLPPCEICVIGQTALLEARLSIQLAATMDVDIYIQIHDPIRHEFQRLLEAEGKTLDPVGHEAWMPKETEYQTIFQGLWVKATVAKPEYILISKAKKAARKNKNLIIEYLGTEPSDLFFELAQTYEIDLEEFLK